MTVFFIVLASASVGLVAGALLMTALVFMIPDPAAARLDAARLDEAVRSLASEENSGDRLVSAMGGVGGYARPVTPGSAASRSGMTPRPPTPWSGA